MTAENEAMEDAVAPDALFVRSVDTDDFLTLVFRHSNRAFNFKRPKAEPCQRLLARIALNLRGPKGKKAKKKKKDAEDMDCSNDEGDLPIGILDSCGATVSGELSSEAALQAGRVLQVGDNKYQVLRNAPGISKLRLPERPLVGCPAFAEVCAEFCDLSGCDVAWFLHPPQPSAPSIDAAGWTLALKGRSFVAASQQVGHWLKVIASPPGGLPTSQVAKAPIHDGPTTRSPIADRHLATAALMEIPGFRVVNYNLLADFYADSDHSRNVLFPYCPAPFLAADYRRQLQLWEIAGYNADLVCLQEVDEGFFSGWLRPFFANHFEAVFLTKGGTREGVALMWRASRFSLEQDVSLTSISAALPSVRPPVEIDRSAKFAGRWKERNHCLLALRLRCRTSGRGLLVATTHLYFHPVADNVRLLQAAVIMQHVEASAHEDDAVLIAGDFNADPRNGVLELATVGRTREKQSDWFSAGKDEYFGSPVIEHGLRLGSAYDPKELEFTNYTAGFRGVLDYIFFQPHRITLERTVPLPPKSAVQQEIALPNELFPSDHLPLIAEFRF